MTYSKTFHIIEYGERDGRERVVGVVHQGRHESAGAERAVQGAQTIARIAGDGAYRVVRQVFSAIHQREIAVVGAEGPVPA